MSVFTENKTKSLLISIQAISCPQTAQVKLSKPPKKRSAITGIFVLLHIGSVSLFKCAVNRWRLLQAFQISVYCKLSGNLSWFLYSQGLFKSLKKEENCKWSLLIHVYLIHKQTFYVQYQKKCLKGEGYYTIFLNTSNHF